MIKIRDEDEGVVHPFFTEDFKTQQRERHKERSLVPRSLRVAINATTWS